MPKHEPTPDVLVELFALGELDPGDTADLLRELQDTLPPRLDAIKRSNAEVLERYPPEQVALELARELAPPPASRTHRGVIAAVAVAASLLLAWGIVRTLDGARNPAPKATQVARASPPSASDIRHKGEPRLLIHRRSGNTLLQSGQRVPAGELLQLSYQAAGQAHGVIVSLDGAGAASLHFPASPEGSTALEEGTVALDHAFELDDAPGFERFFLVTASGPLAVEAILQAARALAQGGDPAQGRLALPSAWRQTSVLLRK